MVEGNGGSLTSTGNRHTSHSGGGDGEGGGRPFIIHILNYFHTVCGGIGGGGTSHNPFPILTPHSQVVAVEGVVDACLPPPPPSTPAVCQKLKPFVEGVVGSRASTRNIRSSHSGGA